MYVVLLSGGSGKRLWPLSNDLRSKQYIRLLADPAGGSSPVSMVQRVWYQLGRAGLLKGAVVCAGGSQKEILEAELGKIPVAEEPARRDTFPAVSLSCCFLKSRMGAKEDDAVVFIPVDPYVDDVYFATLKKLGSVLEKTDADIVLMGARPTSPSSRYGYIVPRAEKDGYCDVEGFKEKPEEEEARKLIARGALWNCGVFCFRIGLILSLLEKQGIPTDYDALYHHYEMLPKKSFDYAVLERAENLKAVPFSGMWKDLGTWNALTEEMASPSVGNVVLPDTNENTHVVNELDIPVVVTGMKDAVVAAAYDGILVTSREEAPHIKDLVDRVAREAMYEEKSWGVVKTIDVTGVQRTRKMTLYAGRKTEERTAESDETWIWLEGKGKAEVDGKERAFGPGSALRVGKGSRVAFTAESGLTCLCVSR